jgi:hypothetical protein
VDSEREFSGDAKSGRMSDRHFSNPALPICIRGYRRANGSRQMLWSIWSSLYALVVREGLSPATGPWMSGTSSFGAGFRQERRMTSGARGWKIGKTAVQQASTKGVTTVTSGSKR